MDFKFIHAADIHLDSPLLGLERYPGAPVEQVRGATRKAFHNLVQLALQEEVDFLLIAGDLYDGDWRDYNTGLYFVSQMARLREKDIRVFIVRGNHDAASQITRSLRLPDNVKDFSTSKPETIMLDHLGAAIHGRGFPTPAVTEDLSRSYPQPVKDYFNIGLLHTCATGREGHANYAPSDPGYLKNKGYDYWALGHVHNGETLSENPWIVFPGNPQGRHIREPGVKGCVLVQVQNGRVESFERRPLDVMRWDTCPVDAGGTETYDQILELTGQGIDQAISRNEGQFLALRLIISGSCSAHHSLAGDRDRLLNDLRAITADRGQNRVWIEKVKLQTTPLAAAEDLPQDSPIAYLLQYAAELSGNEQFLAEVSSELQRELNNLPSELFKDNEAEAAGSQYLQELLPEAEALIASRLLQKEGESR